MKTKSKNCFENIVYKLMVHLERLKNNKRKHRHQACDNWKKKMLASVRAKLSQNKIVFREFTGNRNEQNKSNTEQGMTYRSVSSRHQQDRVLVWLQVRLLVWLHKTKLWGQCETFSKRKIQWYSCRPWKIYWDKNWHIKLWSWETTTQKKQQSDFADEKIMDRLQNVSWEW